jgi:uncharacterized protein YbcV (DUF1398 family)
MMTNAIERLQAAQARGMSVRPKVGGFPYLAEALRQGGVLHNEWQLPACQSLYLFDDGPVVVAGTPLTTGTSAVPPFDRDGLVRALREDQAGRSTFPQFLESAWRAGVVRYDVDFVRRLVAYYGARGEEYVEEYAAVTLP